MIDLIEAMARASYEEVDRCMGRKYPEVNKLCPWERESEQLREDWRATTRAALAALNAEGYVVVPKEPTEAMLEAARIADPMYDDPPTSGATYYSEMLAAAPKVIS